MSLRYDMASQHPLAGRSVPDFKLEDGVTVSRLLRAGKGLLLHFDADAPLQVFNEALARTSQLCGMGLRAVLVRLDSVVAWANETAPTPAEIMPPLRQWFGEPEEPGDQR